MAYSMKNCDTTDLEVGGSGGPSGKFTPYKKGANTGSGKLQEQMFKVMTKMKKKKATPKFHGMKVVGD